MDQKQLAELHARAETELTKIPGVVGVGFGLKEVKGKTTETRAFRVYVKEKKALADVPDTERIPEEFEGIPIDVLVVRDISPLHCEDTRQHHPLIGGITVTNFKSASPGVGTLGFFATLNGVSGPKNVVLVSNNHVLGSNGGGNSDTIYQPKMVEQSGNVLLVDSPESRRAIAVINDIGQKSNYNFAYPSEAAQDYYLDCAMAKLNISISSWCNSNCGVSYKNEIRGLNIGGNSKIEDVDRITQANLNAPGDYVVYKVGRTTSKTVGKVTDIAAVSASGVRIIEIEATQNDCNGIDQFAAEGDSGSAVISASNKLVGLLFAKGSGADSDKGYACHIHPVLARLGITPISTANPPVGPAGQTRSDRRGIIEGREVEDMTLDLKDRFVATERGKMLFDTFMAHREEIVGLVNYHRPVTVAWHRTQGPAFLAHIVENARNPAHRIPFEIEGVPRRELITRMADVLSASGEEALKEDLLSYREEVLAIIDDFDDLHELVTRFEEALANV
ncbi:hypothetical protein P886_4689 [Alteromonadaceae bacterium 2753L.S.0a.02]|nr:hypothetical protein P886_4689 [Alteromonadaceae bacterium 2753L.S.0a.02]